MNVLTTAVDSVSIYRRGAEVVRRGTVELSEGTQKLYVLGLTGSSRTDTVRLFSSEGIKCSNQRFETYGEHLEEKESDIIQKQIDEIERQIGIREMQIEMWQSNGDFTNRSAQTASEIQEYIDKLPERIEKLYGQILEGRKKTEQLAKEKEKAIKKEQLPAVVADITAEKAGTYPFELRYFDNSAEWRPVYELYTDGEGPMEVRMRAKITEHTGEDWNGVSISLYTGNPAAGSTLPELTPVYLDFRTANVMRSSMRMAAKAASMDMMVDRAYEAMEDAAPMAMGAAMAAAAPVRITMEEAEVSDDDTMTEYVIPGKRDVLDNYDGTVADLQSSQVPAEYVVSAAPSADPRAFLTAKVKTEDIPFSTSVAAGVFLRGKYLGTVTVDPDLTKEEIVITLGEEERIKVTRKEVSRKASNAFLKGLRTVDHVFETKVTNVSAAEMSVEIKDQIPVSREKDITVEVKELSGMEKDDKTGIVTGTVTVPAGETITRELSYKVSWPKDKSISETKSPGSGRICPNCGAVVHGTFCPECGSAVN
ncbi:MAG: mucoidy inhibitor MuiA family protein [Oscillospiraceae bacterium]|nr:mucoidy inhibitor MuiA family protein [Oscillospiraceae bacterium]